MTLIVEETVPLPLSAADINVSAILNTWTSLPMIMAQAIKSLPPQNDGFISGGSNYGGTNNVASSLYSFLAIVVLGLTSKKSK